MNFIKEWAGTVALVAIVLTWMFPSSAVFSASGTRMPNGVSADSTSPVAGEVRGTTLTITSTSALTGAAVFSGAVSTGLLTSGGGVTATTSNGAVTLTAANLFGGNVLEHTNTDVATLTLPASTTVTAYIATAGQCRTILYKNLGSATDTLAGGTGTLLSVASSTIGTGLKTVSTGGVAHLLICRTSNTDIEVFMSPAD